VISPYLDRIQSIITNKAMSTAAINNFGELAPKIARLQGTLLTHETQYAVKHTQTTDQANEFWRKNCRNKQLAHSVLTTYAKQIICETIEPYIASSVR